MKCFHLNEMLMSVMERLGKHIARRPYIFILMSFISSIILGMGILFSVYEAITVEFITIRGGKFHENNKVMASLFPLNSSKQFNPARVIDLPLGPLIYVVSKSRGGMLDKSVFRDLDRIDKIVRNVSIETKEGTMKYSNLCAIENGACFVNPIMKIVPKIDDILAGKYRFKYPVHIDERRFEILPIVSNIAGVVEDGEGYVGNFTAVRFWYYCDNSNVNKRAYIRQWIKAIIREFKILQFETIDTYVAAFSEIAADIQDINERLYQMLGAVVVIVILFSMFAFITNSWIRSKPWLGLTAGASATLAITAAYGAMFYAGIRSNDLMLLVAFVVLGTEIDDAFVMVASWRSTSSKDSVEQRLAKTYSEAAVSVTVSSLTSLIAYCVGTIAPITVVHNICVQCAVCIFFTYLYQLLFFGPFMALDGYREKSERNAFTFCKMTSTKRNCNEGKDANKGEESEEIQMKCIKDVLGGLLKFQFGRAVCLLLFAANIITASFSILKLQKGSDVFDILTTGSETEKAANLQVQYFSEYQHTINIMVNKTLNYWDRNVQESVENMLMMFENHPHIADSDLTISWLKFYKMFAEHPFAKSSFMSYNISKKENFLDGLRRAFLRLKPARQFRGDINFNENYTEITSSRYIVLSTNLTGVADESRLMHDIEAIVDKSEIPIMVYSTLFIQAEQASAIGKITMQTIWITSLLMFVVFILLIANFPYAILVTVCVATSMTGTVGFMAAWGVKLDIISLIVVVTCLGFSINYSAHMSYAFTSAKPGTPNEKIKESMYRVGLPVLQGSLSTILAVSILMFQNMYMYIACFKVIFLTVVETAFHSLIVLPAFLSIFDSCVNNKPNPEKERKIQAPSVPVVESYHL